MMAIGLEYLSSNLVYVFDKTRDVRKREIKFLVFLEKRRELGQWIGIGQKWNFPDI
jgi:hypothetical protein